MEEKETLKVLVEMRDLLKDIRESIGYANARNEEWKSEEEM